MSYPQGWRTFCRWKQENPDTLLPANLNLSELNRFAARFRLAQSYQGINLEGYPEPSIDAYSTLFGVFLAYSALEQLYKAVGEPGKVIVEEWAINEPIIANKLRRATRILSFLGNKVDSRELRQRVTKFQQGNDHNILVIAQAVRHLVAHGIMTIHSGKVRPQTTINFCNSLRQYVNDKTQICFTEYVFNSVVNNEQISKFHEQN